ncbi:MAG TPA: hypothetical protein VK631_08445 [Solirubrobacteraceae bacterium]|nr:hypothetical protein [Solirubrobacteraceae bacterium]
MQRTEERTEFLKDIVIGFAEDFGSNPWRQIKSGTYDPDDGIVTFFEIGDDGMHREHDVTIEIVEAGLAKLRSGECSMNSLMRGAILAADAENDAGQIDAYDADAIVQAGVFGELVYG